MLCRLFVFALFVITLFGDSPVWCAPTAEQKKEIEELTTLLSQAGSLFKEKKFQECSDVVKQANAKLESLGVTGDAATLKLLAPLHEKMTRAYGLLELEGIELPPLQPLGEAMKPTPKTKPAPEPKTAPKPANTGLSFVNHVAPLMIAKCGNCHINQTKGGFNMGTYEILMKGPTEGKVIFPGDAMGSRLIEVIESGDMPRGGKLSAQEFDLLKKWINEGAKFDGQNSTTSLAKLVPAGSVPMEAAPEVMMATGKETVSFSRDIAGVLAKTCTGCHGTNNPRENLNLSTFAGLLKGGDSMSPIKPGKGAESLLVMKLRGTANGMRMPSNLPPLENELIDKIQKWIDEGAKFDGADAAMPLDRVASLAKAAGATPTELANDRMKLADATWATAMPGIKSDRHESENLYIVGNVGENTLKDILQRIEEQIPKIATLLGAPTDKQLIKGRMSLFVLKERYDFGEVAKLIINLREIPTTSKGFWMYNGTDAAGVIRAPRVDTDYSIEALGSQQIAATYVSTLGKNVPGWFAEGVGRNMASKIAPGDPRVHEWDSNMVAAFQVLTTPDAFMGKGIEPEMSSIAAYSYVKFLMKNTKNFQNLLEGLRKGGKFDDVFTATYGGTPNALTANWYRQGPSKPPKTPLKSAAK
jgi:Planctomycete cytochrome C